MAFFDDLTPHTYSPTCDLDVLNVGWLDEGRAFAVGRTSRKFQEALLRLCEHPIIRHRGRHTCWFCRGRRRKVITPAHAGNGQIRVLSKIGNWYAAPTLVYHYVTQHRYRPPTEFIEAVIAPVAVGADHGWFENPRKRPNCSRPGRDDRAGPAPEFGRSTVFSRRVSTGQ